MYRIRFYELQMRGISSDTYAKVYIKSVPKLNKERVYHTVKMDDVIPSIGIIRIDKNGAMCAGFIYEILSIQKIIPDTFEIVDDKIVVEIDEEKLNLSLFTGYDQIKNGWFQLNTSEDPYVISLKLEKVYPESKNRSFSRGNYWIYKVVKLVIYCPEKSNLELDQDVSWIGPVIKKQIETTNEILADLSSNPPHISLA